MDRGALRIGAAGALASAALTAAQLAVGVAVHGGSPSAAPPFGATLLLAALQVLSAAALGAAAYGAWAALTPSTRLLRTVTLAGGLGATATIASAAARLVQAGARPPPATLTLTVGDLALLATAFWMVGVSAADWRRRRWPAWVRVAGTAAGALALCALVIPELAALALPFALAFWAGLGVALAEMARRA